MKLFKNLKHLENHRQQIQGFKNFQNKVANVPEDQNNGGNIPQNVTAEEFENVLENLFNMPPFGREMKEAYNSEKKSATLMAQNFEPVKMKYFPIFQTL